MEPEQGQSNYTPQETERGLRFGIADGVCSFGMFTLSSGAILAALALFAGMSDIEFGILAALPFLTQLLQLPGALLLRRYQNRKRLTIGFATVGRLALLGVAASVFFLDAEARRIGVFASFLVWAAFGAIAAGAWLWWMRDLVPEDRLGRYFGTRGAYLLGASAPILLSAGIFLDLARSSAGVPGERLAFTALYVVGALLGVGSSIFLSFIPHRPPKEDPTKVSLREAVRAPFADANFRRLLQWLTLWGLGSTLTIPFFPIFLLVDHGLPISVVTALLVMGTGTTVLFFWLWGRLSDRYGNKPVLAACVPVLAAGLLLTLAVPRGSGPLTYAFVVVIQILVSIGTAGADLTSWNLAFKLAKGPATPAYLTGTLLVRALTTGVGPIAAGIVAALLAATTFSVGLPLAGGVTLFELRHVSFLFVIGAALIVLSATPLSLVREQGEAPRADLLQALRAEAASDGLYPGVRHFAVASSFLVRAVVRGGELAKGALPGRGKGDK